MGTIIVQTGPRGENVGHFARSLPESNATGFPRSNSSTSIEASPHRDVYSHHRQMNDSGVSGRRNYNISRAAPFPVEVVQGTRHEAKASHGAYTHIVSNDEFQNVQGRIGGPKRR